MASFDIRQLRRVMKGAWTDISTIVETGTCRGVGTEVMAREFARVYTIELDETLHAQTRERLAPLHPNVTFVHGDSAVRLGELVEQIDEPAVFFLDAHWSGDRTVDWEHSSWKGYRFDTAHTGTDERPSGPEQVPLDREFQAIGKRFPHRCIIYVDDVDKFDRKGKGLKDKCFVGEDWSHLSFDMLEAALGDRIDAWKRKGSQLLIRVRPLGG